ncbi:unnamed protein product [Urochloa humidicola]
MAGSGSSLLRGFLSLFFLLFIHIGHAGCCFSPGSAGRSREDDDATEVDADGKVGGGGSNKRRKISPLVFSPAVSSSAVTNDSARARRRHVSSSVAASLRFYLHRIFSSSSGAKDGATVAGREEEEAATMTTTVSSPVAQSSLPPQPSTASVVLSTPPSPCASSPFMSPLSVRSLSATPAVPSSPQKLQASRQSSSSSRSFAARGDVFPCKVCGEVLGRPQLLELHQAMRHSLSELTHLDSSMGIIRMIFLAGWRPSAPGAGQTAAPAVRRILRIHHNPRALARFEEYRDAVRARAARRRCDGEGVEERCVADGNERLRFHCSTMLCSLGGGGACGSPYCCVCSTLRHGFAGKQADVDGIATYASAWAAHASLPGDVEREFAFLQVRRAMLVCRVVAGRVGRGAADDKVAYDSIVPVRGATGGGDDVELLVFNPRAVLPCFVILYSC